MPIHFESASFWDIFIWCHLKSVDYFYNNSSIPILEACYTAVYKQVKEVRACWPILYVALFHSQNGTKR